MTFQANQPGEADVAHAAADYDHWRRKNRFYYDQLARLFRRHIPPGARVLEIGCEGGDLLAFLKPARGVGVEPAPALAEVARERHPELTFITGGPEDVPPGETFDFIVICNSVGHMYDVQRTLAALQPLCGPETRVIVAYHNTLWEPILSLGSRLGLRRRVPGQNWLSRDDLANLLTLSGFDVISTFCEILLPKRVPLLSAFLNRLVVKFWPFRHLALSILLVARPRGPAMDRSQATVSVIVPTRNERGNIESVVQRTPTMGAGTEIIFVDGWSTDGTVEEIQRCMAAHPERPMRFIAQEGARGKGQAVRQGFDAAKGDILMILDADLTVAPEDLPKFFDALVDGLGEFVNGTRLVYPMQDHAMRFLNKCGNRFFSSLFTWLIGQRFRDTLCGTKVLTKRNYERIAAGRAELGLLDPFGDFDLIFGAARCDLKIIEVPVRYGARTYGETNISRFRDFWLLLAMSWRAFLKIKLR
ncbi:MAG TPA: glycosyltransferase [Phycisphaerae bacterium]|nr:glycosyltransferase [Phycisphaerae bacterium]